MADTVVFNVGGVRYELARSTLLLHPDPMLAVLVSERWESEEVKEPLFVDRDGQRFQFVLDFYRDGRARVPVDLFSSVQAEFEYFGLPKSAVSKDPVYFRTSLDAVIKLKLKQAYTGLAIHLLKTAVATGRYKLVFSQNVIYKTFGMEKDLFNGNELKSVIQRIIGVEPYIHTNDFWLKVHFDFTK